MESTKHEGRNIKRIREMLGMKQETLAELLGFNQQKISLLEQKDMVDPQVMEEVAKALKVPVEAIKNFDDEAAINYINTFNDSSVNHGANFNYKCDINPIEKLVEVVEENKKLYERLLKSEQEKVQLLESVLKSKN